jgi:hypothetical protein
VVVKTLRTYLAESLGDLAGDELILAALTEIVETATTATRDWLAQAEILVTMSNGMAETGSVGGAALALRREAVK